MSVVESVKVVLLGESGVGKSSVALRFVTDEFRPYSEATIGASFMSKSVTIPASSPVMEDSTSEDNSENYANGNKSQSTPQRHIGFKIWDTAGQEKYRSLAPMYYRGSSAAILVYDITKPGSFAALQDWSDELKKNGPPDLVLAVCGNKSDLQEDRLVGRSNGEEYAKSIGALYIETSAKGGEGIDNLFVEVAKRVPPPITMGDEYLEEDAGLDLGKSSEHSTVYGC
mmetsp:Transcript_24470/g.42864  ORF Transcript_24470/g.42864 Transcript_24470/m.42864 type:complete len:227 (-) Transcript_24470:1956-2636(-)